MPLLAAVLLSMPVGAVAQQAPPDHNSMMSQLTDAQRAQIMPIMQDGMQRSRSIMGAAHEREMAALSAEHRARVQAVLDQLPAPPPRPAAGQGPPPRNGPGMHGDGGHFRAAGQQIDAVLTPAETQAVIAVGQDARTQLKAVQDDMHNKISPILTDAQRQTMDQMKQNRGMRPHTDDAGMYLLMGARAAMGAERQP
ncbi:MAG: hypothetical protein DLM50_07385 [Candidatus Meridianibacter frigidus]|nr:MAG: hypothetical protein DLM50_07385 [Candidatus Eremiobacteraeota bacterium]